jgi:hypothetical protein
MTAPDLAVESNSVAPPNYEVEAVSVLPEDQQLAAELNREASESRSRSGRFED